ncbi:MAG TPA: sulfurtransferase TusA family protein [Firmicutes bacterium]|nr:sulfurtransferase TusA family protein [Bacillota bacterium]
MEIKETLDTRGMVCPMPVLKTAKRIKEVAKGVLLEVLADDEGAIEDFPAWCEQTGNTFVKYEKREDYFSFIIKKGE